MWCSCFSLWPSHPIRNACLGPPCCPCLAHQSYARDGNLAQCTMHRMHRACSSPLRGSASAAPRWSEESAPSWTCFASLSAYPVHLSSPVVLGGAKYLRYPTRSHSMPPAAGTRNSDSQGPQLGRPVVAVATANPTFLSISWPSV